MRPIAYLPVSNHGWACYKTDESRIDLHWLPINDSRNHTSHSKCWCHPREEDNCEWFHNSHDGREDYECGIRKAN